MTWAVTTPPVEEPISLADAKLHLRVRNTAEDSLVSLWITTARAHVEDVCERALMPQRWTQTRDDFPRPFDTFIGAFKRARLATLGVELPHPLAIELRGGNVTEIVSFSYVDLDGEEQTLDSGDYTFDADRALVYPLPGDTWPRTVGPVRIEYAVGYADADHVPAPLRAAMLLMLGDLYENRKANSIEAGVTAVVTNPTVDRLLAPYGRLSA